MRNDKAWHADCRVPIAVGNRAVGKPEGRNMGSRDKLIEEYCDKIDAELTRLCGERMDSLGDVVDIYYEWGSGNSPKRVARKILRLNGFPMDALK